MIIKNHYALISCICITDNRPDYLINAILYFDYQNYPNKELVISYPKGDLASRNLINEIKSHADINISTIERENGMSLGMARNEAILRCNGEYVCTWDDDDWYREFRLIYQYQNLRSTRQKFEACILTKVILYDSLKNQAYFSEPYIWIGTLFCKTEIILQYPYLDSNNAEGTNLMNYLISSRYVTYLENYNLYAFIYHGANGLNGKQYTDFLKNTNMLDSQNKELIDQLMNREIRLEIFN